MQNRPNPENKAVVIEVPAEVKYVDAAAKERVSRLKWISGGTAVSTLGKGCVNVCGKGFLF